MWKALKYILLLYILIVVFAFFFYRVAVFLHFDASARSCLLSLGGIISFLLFICIVFANKQVHWSTNSLKPSLFVVVCIGLLVNLLFYNTNSNTGVPDSLPMGLLGVCLCFVESCVLCPIAEEILFRRIVLNSLLANRHFRYKPIWPILITALLFSLIHISPARYAHAFIDGLFFTWIAYRTKSIIPSIVLHSFNNFYVFMIRAISNNYFENLTTAISKIPYYEYLCSLWRILQNDVIRVLICVCLLFLLNRFLNKKYPKDVVVPEASRQISDGCE